MLCLGAVDGDWLGVLDLNGETGESSGAGVEVNCVLAAYHLVVLSLAGFGGSGCWSGLIMLVVDQRGCV